MAGLLEELQQRMNPTNYYRTPYGADLEPVTEYTAEGVPVTSLKRKKSVFPDPYAPHPPGETPLENVAMPPAPPPIVPPLAAMAPQAGLMAPNMGPMGGAPGPLAPAPPAPEPPPAPEVNPNPVADGAVPVPMARPDTAPTDISARARPPGAPIQIAPQAPVAPAPMAGADVGMMPGGSLLDRIRTGLGDNSNTLLAIGAGFAGAQNWGQAISRAASAAIPARAADIKQTLTKQTQGTGYKALVAAGVPTDLALAALGNPAIMKSVTENYLGDRKGQIIDIGFDRYGQPIKGIFDPYTKTIKPVAAALPPAARVPGGTDTADIAGTGDATDISAAAKGAPNPGVGSGVPVTAENDIAGPDYLQRLKETDPAYARQVEQVLNGDAAMPTGRQAQTPQGRKLRQDVLTVEPGASDSDFATRTMVRKSYTGGNDSKITKSINTTLKHAGTLEKAINDLDNFSTAPVLNYPRALIEGQTSEKYRKARAAYDTAVANFAKELDFTVSGGRPTVSGTKHQMEGFDATAAKDAQLEKLRTGVELLKGRLDSHASGYAKGLKKTVEPVDFVDPANRQIYKRLIGDETEPTGVPVPGIGAAAPVAARGTVPKPGKYIYDPTSGTMVPTQ